VTIGDSKVLGKNDDIYVSGHRSGTPFLRPNRIVLNNSDQLFYDDRQYISEHNNELIFNDRGELIGFHQRDRHSIDDEGLWPEYSDYPYPTLDSLLQLYNTSHAMPDLDNWHSKRAGAVAIRNRYGIGETTENLSLVIKKLGLKVNIQQDRQSLLTKNEDNLAAALNLSGSLYHRDNTEFIEVIDLAIKTNPLNADLYGMRGNARLSLKYQDKYRGKLTTNDQQVLAENNRKMLADYDQAISLNPQDRISLFLRSNLKTESKDYHGALADLDRLVVLQPNSSVVYYHRGYLKQHHLKDFAGALSDYSRLVEMNPNVASAYLNRGLLQEQDIHDFPAALADYNRVLEIVAKTSTPNDPLLVAERKASIYYFIARLKAEKMQDYRGALADYNRIPLSSSQEPKFYWDRAKVKARLQDIKGAMTDVNLAMRNRYSGDYLLRAEFKLKYLNDQVGAFVDYNQAVKSDPSDPRAYYERGMFINTYRNDRAAAKANFQKALKLLNKQEDKFEDDLELLKKIKLALGI
jgi:tetratricopeptide (TPR) repeat protein